MSRVPEVDGYPMERYYKKNVTRWKTAYDTVLENVSFTDAGLQLINEFEQVGAVLDSHMP
jgi:hypothetical protein